MNEIFDIVKRNADAEAAPHRSAKRPWRTALNGFAEVTGANCSPSARAWNLPLG